MNFKMTVSRIVVFSCLCVLPELSFANPCLVTTVNNLLGTTCSIGDVNFAFIAISFGGVIPASSITLTPNAFDPLNPAFSLTGPFSVTATGLGNESQIHFFFNWDATILVGGLEFGSATETLINPVLPKSPSGAFIDGATQFTNAFVHNGGPGVNPSTGTIDLTSLTGPHFDQAFGSLIVVDGTGNGATTSVDAFENQYHLTPVPESSSLFLLGTGLLGLVGLMSRKLLA